MARARAAENDASPSDPSARVIDDRIAEACERIDRLEKAAAGPAGAAQRAAQDIEQRGRERVAAEQEAPMDKQAGKGAERTSLAALKEAARDLKERIVEQKRRSDLPIDSALGNPEEEARNADGRNDLPDRDED